MHASGTSGPLSHVATEPKMGIRQELLDRLLASRDDGAIFLTAAKTDKGSDAWHDLFQHRIRRNEQTVKSVRRMRFPDTAWCKTFNSDRTEKEDDNEICLIDVPLRLPVEQ